MGFSLKKVFGKEEPSDDYIEIDVDRNIERKEKIRVRPFTLRKYDDVNEILNALREGYSIAIIDIQPLKKKDIIELKRSITKIKKTTDALEGSIAGFGEHTIIVTPDFAEIHKEPQKMEKKDAVSYY
jgi:SepF-like predicted cell division protein (DUF552 family)